MGAEGDQLLAEVRRALPVTAALVAAVGDDEWDASTVCGDMSVLGLVEHLVGGMRQFAGAAEGSPFDPAGEAALEPAGAAAAFDDAAAALLAAFETPGAADRVYVMPWGEVPGTTLLGFTVIEQVVHGWDLARAIGREPAYDDELAASALEGARRHDDPSIRVPGMFGPEVAVADNAPVVDRLAAFLGRQPDWRQP